MCWLYSSTLTQLPALVRQWWTSLDAKITQIVERVTSMYVSPNLINQELNDVMKYQSKFKNMVVSKRVKYFCFKSIPNNKISKQNLVDHHQLVLTSRTN